MNHLMVYHAFKNVENFEETAKSNEFFAKTYGENGRSWSRSR
jgi:hypothetical protein